MVQRRLIDFGGKCAANTQAKSVLLKDQNLVSMRCNSCNKLNYVGFIETQRAAAPRCNACGGGLTEIEESYKRRTGCSYKRAEKMGANASEKPFTCVTCKTKFRSPVALNLHIKDQHPGVPPIDAQQMLLDYSCRKRHTK